MIFQSFDAIDAPTSEAEGARREGPPWTEPTATTGIEMAARSDEAPIPRVFPPAALDEAAASLAPVPDVEVDVVEAEVESHVDTEALVEAADVEVDVVGAAFEAPAPAVVEAPAPAGFG